MKDNIYKDLNKMDNIKIEKRNLNKLEKTQVVKQVKQSISDIQEQLEKINDVQKVEVINPVEIPEPKEIQKVEVTNPQEITIPEQTTIKNTDEIAEKLAKAIPQPLAPVVNVPKEITVSNFPKPEKFVIPETYKISNWADLFSIGNKAGQTDPSRYIPVRLTDGDRFYKALDQFYVAASKGSALSSGGGSSSIVGTTTVSGQMQGVYNSTAPTLTNGQVYTQQLDVNANLKNTLGTKIAGENLTTDRLNVEPVYSYSNVLADAQIKSGAGTLHSLTFSSDAAATAGTLILYDNTAESGTVILTITFVAAYAEARTLILDISFATGLYAGFTTTGDVSCTFAYR